MLSALAGLFHFLTSCMNGAFRRKSLHFQLTGCEGTMLIGMLSSLLCKGHGCLVKEIAVACAQD